MYLDVIDVSGLILKILWNDVFYLCGDMCLDQWLWFLWHLCFLDVTTPAISFTSTIQVSDLTWFGAYIIQGAHHLNMFQEIVRIMRVFRNASDIMPISKVEDSHYTPGKHRGKDRTFLDTGSGLLVPYSQIDLPRNQQLVSIRNQTIFTGLCWLYPSFFSQSQGLNSNVCWLWAKSIISHILMSVRSLRMDQSFALNSKDRAKNMIFTPFTSQVLCISFTLW